MADTAKSKKDKKPNRFVRWFKETRSELKKITWPTFSHALRQTGVVLLVVVLFLAVLMVIDFGLGELYKLLTKELGTATSSLVNGTIGTLLQGFSSTFGGALWL